MFVLTGFKKKTLHFALGLVLKPYIIITIDRWCKPDWLHLQSLSFKLLLH